MAREHGMEEISEETERKMKESIKPVKVKEWSLGLFCIVLRVKTTFQ
jgi:hypothetical protein